MNPDMLLAFLLRLCLLTAIAVFIIQRLAPKSWQEVLACLCILAAAALAFSSYHRTQHTALAHRQGVQLQQPFLRHLPNRVPVTPRQPIP